MEKTITILVYFKNGEVKAETVNIDRAGDKLEELADIENVAWIKYNY